MQAGKTRQGASTLTQQLARNSFPYALPSDDRSFRRKFLEMFVAFEIEDRLKKDEILELYLNRVYFGSGFYGAEAAAQGYFGKKAADLTISESALLAGLLRSPNHLSPWKNRRAGMDSRNHVLSRMRELNAITQVQYEEALANEPEVRNRRPILMENYATDMVASQMARLVGQEESSSEGYRIYTTVDLNLQRRAEAALKKQLEAIEQRPEFKTRQSFDTFDSLYRAWRKRISTGQDEPAPRPEYLQGAIVILDNHTGAIRAIVGGRDARHTRKRLQAVRIRYRF
jgi:penicillin-binding protein 1A